MTNSTLLNVRGGWSRFQEPNVRQHEGVFDPASLGFSSTTVGYFGGASYMPRFDFDSLTDIGDNIGATTTHSIYSLQPTMTRALRQPLDAWRLRHAALSRGRVEPGAPPASTEFRHQLHARSATTRARSSARTSPASCSGCPPAARIDRNASRLNDTWYHGVFVQDDWKVTDRLTVNLGLRYEYEGATTDSQNRNVRGFDPSAAVSIAGGGARGLCRAVRFPSWRPRPLPCAAACSSPPTATPVSTIRTTTTFSRASASRIRLTDKTVVRGGWGIYAVPEHHLR